jgi:hypothetical protein
MDRLEFNERIDKRLNEAGFGDACEAGGGGGGGGGGDSSRLRW